MVIFDPYVNLWLWGDINKPSIEFHKKFGVTEFHLEDVDPTVNENRTRDMCEAIINADLNITWKVCAGTKIETIRSLETIELMAKSGCNYISISPESGSKELMKKIEKPFSNKR